MKVDEAKQMVERLRFWGRWRTLPRSDEVLLRSQAEANENVSFILAIILFSSAGHLGIPSWSDLWLLFVLVFIVFCRIEAGRFRSSMQLFESQGPQMVENLKE